MNELKPGDRAVIVRSVTGGRPEAHGSSLKDCGDGHAGGTCVILRGPERPWDRRTWYGHELICEVRMDCCGKTAWTPRGNLMRLPPDSEMRQMTRETERPRELSHATK